MKISILRSMAAALILVFVSVSSVMADIPTGWLVAESTAKDYKCLATESQRLASRPLTS